MSYDRSAVRAMIEAARATGRTVAFAGRMPGRYATLTRSRCPRRRPCRRPPRPAAPRRDRLSGSDENRFARHPAQDRSGRRDARRAERGRGRASLRKDRAPARARTSPARRSPACKSSRCSPAARGDCRRTDRSELRQGGRLRSRRRAGRSAQGRNVSPGAGEPRRGALDDQRDRGRGDSQRRARRGGGRQGRARQDYRSGLDSGRGVSGNRRARSEPGVGAARRRGRARRARAARLRAAQASVTGPRARKSCAR